MNAAAPIPTRIYLVARKLDFEVGDDPSEKDSIPRLVRAAHPSTALRHVAQDLYEVRVASQDDIIAALAKDAQVEQAGEQP